MKLKDIVYRIPLTRYVLFSLEFIRRKKNELKITPHLCGTGKEIYPKDIYIIRWNNPSAGLFAYILNIMGEIWYAEQKGYVPVVDMQSQLNTYLTDAQVGYNNAWNFYFEDVGGIGINECGKYKNVYISNGMGMPYSPCPSVGWMNSKKEICLWQEMAKKYLVLKPEVKRFCEQEYKAMIADGERVLGVKCRGTDYNPISAKGHPIQPSVDQVIKRADKIMAKYNCDKIYLSTEDKQIVQRFKKHYGRKLVVSTSFRVDYDIHTEACVSSYSTNRDNDKYLQGLEYLRDEYVLSKCNCLIGGINGGTAGALLMGKGFEYTYFWYLGRY